MRIFLLLLLFFGQSVFAAVNYPSDMRGATTYYEMPNFRGAAAGSTKTAETAYKAIEDGVIKERLSGATGAVYEATKIKVPFTARFAWGAGKAATAARAVMKGSLFSPQGLLAYAGISAFIEAMNWVVNDKGQLVRKPKPNDDVGEFADGNYWRGWRDHRFQSPDSACAYDAANSSMFSRWTVADVHGNFFDCRAPGSKSCSNSFNCPGSDYRGGGRFVGSYVCKTGTYDPDKHYCVLDIDSTPVSAADIDSADWSKYVPQDSDIPAISKYLGTPDSIDFDPPQPISGATTTVRNSDGSRTVTNHVYTPSFSASDPSNSSPAVNIRDEKHVKTYDSEGNQTSDNTTTTTTDNSSTSLTSSTSSDIPTDCDFMPTACNYFKKMEDEDDTIADAPTLPVEQKQLSFSPISHFSTAGSCPADVDTTYTFMGSTFDFNWSYTPICTYASRIKALLVLLAYAFAAFLVFRALSRT